MSQDDPTESPAEESTYRELEDERVLPREEVTAHLDSFLEAFRDGETVTMTIGGETVEFDPPEHLRFELEYEEAGDERELEFELEWQVHEDDLEIESPDGDD